MFRYDAEFETIGEQFKSFISFCEPKARLNKDENTKLSLTCREEQQLKEDEIKEQNFWQAFSFNFQLGTQTMYQFFIEAYKAKKLNYNSTIEYLEKTWLNEPIERNYLSTEVEIKPLDTLKPSLNRIFNDGPDVSLKGSPTVSPTTVAL